MLGQPGADIRVLVGGVVVDDEMKVQVSRGGPIDVLEKVDKFFVAVAFAAGAEDRAVQNIQGSEQGGGTVPFVVVGEGATAAFLHRQAWLGPVQCLNLAFLIHAEHQSMLGRVEIESDHIP